MLTKLIYPSTSASLPIISDYKKSPKLQFLDTGFINYLAGLQQAYYSLSDLNAIYKGLIAEHIVGQELIFLDLSLNRSLNFWVREKRQSREYERMDVSIISSIEFVFCNNAIR